MESSLFPQKKPFKLNRLSTCKLLDRWHSLFVWTKYYYYYYFIIFGILRKYGRKPAEYWIWEKRRKRKEKWWACLAYISFLLCHWWDNALLSPDSLIADWVSDRLFLISLRIWTMIANYCNTAKHILQIIQFFFMI